jgi:hypothetical protein
LSDKLTKNMALDSPSPVTLFFFFFFWAIFPVTVLCASFFPPRCFRSVVEKYSQSCPWPLRKSGRTGRTLLDVGQESTTESRLSSPQPLRTRRDLGHGFYWRRLFCVCGSEHNRGQKKTP